MSSRLAWAGCLCGAVCFIGFAAQAAPKFQTLYEFCSQPGCTDGINPEAALVQDADGNLYGTTLGGGSGFGTIFELVHGTTYKLLYTFCSLSACSDGVSPRGALIVDTSGNLYGTTSGGGANGAGAVFELAKAGTQWNFRSIYNFCSKASCTDGSQPGGTDIGVTGSLAYDGAAIGQLYDGSSALYGTTESGGSKNSGIVYSLTLSNGVWKEKVLYNFCSLSNCADGSSGGNLIASGSSVIYGTTGSGHGGVFKLALNAKKTRWSLTTIYGFCKKANCADGDVPTSLTLASSGKLYGTTSAGGSSGTFCFFSAGCGTVFGMAPSAKRPQETVLYNFCSVSLCTDGAQPVPGLAIDASGVLYGATNTGGSDLCFDGCGVVFKLQGKTETVLYSLCSQEGCTEGTSPGAGVILDSAGDVFGTTNFGGMTGGGTAYEITP